MTGLEAVAARVNANGLPSSQHTERVVLGAMQDSPDSLQEGLELCDSRCFSLDSHRRVFAAYHALAETGTPVNLETTADQMKRMRSLEQVGGRAFLMSLTEGLPRDLRLATYAKILRRKSAEREILGLIENIAGFVVDETEDPEDLLEKLVVRAHEIETGNQRTYKPLAASVGSVVSEMMHQRDRADGLLGITTGLSTLDELTTGYRNGELTYVGGLPNRGKTPFLLQGAYRAAMAGVPVGIISLEMRTEQLIKRLALMATDLEPWQMRDAKKMNVADFGYAMAEVEALGNLPIQVSDIDGLKPAEISSMARRMVRNDGVRILFVDFVQIVNEQGRTQKEAIDRVSAALRAIAKTLNIPVVVGSQLARRDNDVNRVPTLQDLRESGNLEQDAHNVLLLYRPIDKSDHSWTGEDQIIIAKCREGPTGSIPARFDSRSLIFVPREATR